MRRVRSSPEYIRNIECVTDTVFSQHTLAFHRSYRLLLLPPTPLLLCAIPESTGGTTDRCGGIFVVLRWRHIMFCCLSGVRDFSS
jgi:hypothetical protein